MEERKREKVFTYNLLIVSCVELLYYDWELLFIQSAYFWFTPLQLSLQPVSASNNKSMYIHYNTADSAISAIIPYYKRDNKLLKSIIVICAYEY